MTIVRRAARRVRLALRRAPGTRLAYVRVPVERRLPRPFALRVLRTLTGERRRTLAAYLAEAGRGSALDAHISASEATYLELCPSRDAGTLPRDEGALLYALVRAIRPAVVVETGTANGVSTSFILAALERNGAGRLISIDLPFADAAGELVPIVSGSEIDVYDASPLPPGKEPGWMVPAELRNRWELRLGDARHLLPAAVAEVRQLGLFLHDSLHTREHMLFEFQTAWPALAAGGVLAADDVFLRKHDALPAFARAVGRPWVSFKGMGFIGKPAL